MGYIFVDREGDGLRGEMRRNMRENMRHEGYSPMMHGDSEKEHWYRMGYKEGWHDHEDEVDMRSSRDSRGRYI